MNEIPQMDLWMSGERTNVPAADLMAVLERVTASCDARGLSLDERKDALRLGGECLVKGGSVADAVAAVENWLTQRFGPLPDDELPLEG